VSAPLLIVNGRPWSGRPLEGDAVLVHDGRIVAVGPAPAFRDERAVQRVIDAHGGTITPGLVDAHIHLVPWARARRQPDLDGCASREEALERVRAALAALADEPDSTGEPAPLVGRGWDDAGWEAPPEASALDALAPERPVLLHRHDFHALWANTAALRAAGVSKATPDPEGGVFVRGPGGEPSGLVREHAVRMFLALEERAAPAVDEALLDQAAGALHAEGVTAVHDFQRTQADWERMRSLAGRHKLRVLQHVGLEQVADARRVELRGGEGDAWFRTGALKLFADGTLGSRTAAMLDPYDDTPGRGMTLLTADEMARSIDRAAAAGFSVAIHAIGDAAVRHALDAIGSRRGGPPPPAQPPPPPPRPPQPPPARGRGASSTSSSCTPRIGIASPRSALRRACSRSTRSPTRRSRSAPGARAVRSPTRGARCSRPASRSRSAPTRPSSRRWRGSGSLPRSAGSAPTASRSSPANA